LQKETTFSIHDETITNRDKLIITNRYTNFWRGEWHYQQIILLDDINQIRRENDHQQINFV